MIPTDRDVEIIRQASMLLSGLGPARQLLPQLAHLADRMAEEISTANLLGGFGDAADAESVDKEFGYIHERIDQLIRQCALEVGIRDAQWHQGAMADCVDLSKNRFWAADDAAAEKCHKTPRER